MFVKIREKVYVNLDHIYKIQIVDENKIRLFFMNDDSNFEYLVETDATKFIMNMESQISGSI